jgi:hypothetical protein
MHEAPGPAETTLRQFGRRNLVYLLLGLVVILAGLALHRSGRPAGHWMALGLVILWGAVSAVFLFANALMLAAALQQRRRAVPAFIACLLPPLLALLGWVLLPLAAP